MALLPNGLGAFWRFTQRIKMMLTFGLTVKLLSFLGKKRELGESHEVRVSFRGVLVMIDTVPESIYTLR